MSHQFSQRRERSDRRRGWIYDVSLDIMRLFHKSMSDFLSECLRKDIKDDKTSLLDLREYDHNSKS